MSTPSETIERAVGTVMHVEPCGPGMYHVLSESGDEYAVDTDALVCDCPASLYGNGDACKHIIRCAAESVLGDEFELPAFDPTDHPCGTMEFL
jgi:hypothetical protein